MQFSNPTYSRLKSRLNRKYNSDLQKALKKYNQFPEARTAKWLRSNHEELLEFSPKRWYYLKQLESLFFFLSQSETSENDEIFSFEDDQIFERWNSSEFADVFLKFLNKRIPLRKASKETTKIFDQHLITLGNLHLLQKSGPTKNYRLQGSLGDIVTKGRVSKLLQTTLHLEGKDLVLLTASLKEMKDFSSRIEVALKLIRRLSLDSWERFAAFTDVIIPIKQKEFVSYSHQELPGTSMINFYHRDFVDLLDDLLHENGHHHLNYYLNLTKLIAEPIDCIYYSPWRRTLRPLRGIYHAYFTFFWAFKLFSDLARSGELDSKLHTFTESEKEKILWRSVEEYWMLEYTFVDLTWAWKQGLISDLGWELVKEQRVQMRKFKAQIPLWEKKLRSQRNEIKDLKKTLANARKQFIKD